MLQSKRGAAVEPVHAHFLHIGKTGGTAVKEALSEVTSTRFHVTLHDHNYTINDVARGEKVFFFVRDPISRFVSGFNSRKRQGQPRYFSPWSHEEKVAFEKFATPEELALGLQSGDPDMRAAAESAMKSISHVRDSYWKWFDNEDTLLSRMGDVLFVGSQERLDDDFRMLWIALEANGNGQLPRDPVKAHKNPGHMPRQLGSDARATLFDWYARDYEFLSLLSSRFTNLPKYDAAGASAPITEARAAKV